MSVPVFAARPARPVGSTKLSVSSSRRWLLERTEAGAGPGLVARLVAALAGREGGGTVEASVAALCALTPAAEAPVLLAVRRSADPPAPAWVDSASTSLARLAEAAPRLTLGLAVDPGALAAYLVPGMCPRPPVAPRSSCSRA